MCAKCDELVRLIEQTRDGQSVVVTSFPNGKPKLVRRPSDEMAVTYPKAADDGV